MDASGDEIFDGVVRASMAELELEGLAPEGLAEHLIAQADPHYRLDADEGAHRIGDLAEEGGVAGAGGRVEGRRDLSGECLPHWCRQVLR